MDTRKKNTDELYRIVATDAAGQESPMAANLERVTAERMLKVYRAIPHEGQTFSYSIEPQFKKKVHYITGSGSHGCLYDNGPHAHTTLKNAVDDLAETFELGRTRKSQLKRDCYLELNPRRDGASYCEITTCSCGKPWEHNEDDDSENWPDYAEGR